MATAYAALLAEVRNTREPVIKMVKVEGGRESTEFFLALARTSFVESRNDLQDNGSLVVCFGLTSPEEDERMEWYPYGGSGIMPKSALEWLGVKDERSLTLDGMRVPTDLPVRHDASASQEIEDVHLTDGLHDLVVDYCVAHKLV